jgi:hypothetical protein
MEYPNIVSIHTNDNRRLTETRDCLFLFALLRRHQTSWRYYTTLFEEDSEVRFVLAEDRAGQLYHPITGQAVTKSDSWSVKERVRYKKVRDHYFARYRWRIVLQADYAPDESIRAGRMTIWKGGRLNRVRHVLFSLSRKYPLGGHLDRLLESPDAYFERVAKTIDAASESDRQADYFCPLDGVVEPIEIVSSSPAWTWDQLCGREFTSEVCPHCLFGFNTRLTTMN